MKAFTVGVKDNGKKDLKVVPYTIDHLDFYEGAWHPNETPCRSQRAQKICTDFVEIPCGRCIGCRLEYSRQWANRLILELEYHESSYFVTLTYDDDHVPRVPFGNDVTGEVAGESFTLSVDDCQKFMKRLRKDCNEHIRYFLAGEYGPSTLRPHYHAIIFGLVLDDLKVYKRSPQGFTYYESPFLSSKWQKGFVVVAPVTWETCAYTARYVTKKLTGELAEFYETFNLKPPFCLMSRRPGIAHQWYIDHPDVMDFEYINLSTTEGARKFRPPKYYEMLFELEKPELSAERKEFKRRCAEEAKKLKLSQTDLPYLDMLSAEEYSLERRINALVRDKI